MITAQFPPHRTPKSTGPDIINLPRRDQRRIIANHLPITGRIAPARNQSLVVVFLRTRMRESLVVPHPILPRPLPNALKRPAGPLGLLERAPVKRESTDEFVRPDATGYICADGRVGVKRRDVGHVWRGVDVRHVPRFRVPAAGEIITHQVPEVEELVHLADSELGIVHFPAWRGDGEQEAFPLQIRRGEIIQCPPRFMKEEHEVICLLGVLGVFPVYIDAVEAQVRDELYRGLREVLAALRRGGGRGEVGGVGPAAYGEKDVEVAVLFFEQE